MDWMQVITIVGSTVGCCFYFRKETQADLMEVKGEMKEIRECMNEFRKETKDFHGRMCTLEEKYQNIVRERSTPVRKAGKAEA